MSYVINFVILDTKVLDHHYWNHLVSCILMIDKIKEKLKDLNSDLSFNGMPQEVEEIYDTMLVSKELL